MWVQCIDSIHIDDYSLKKRGEEMDPTLKSTNLIRDIEQLFVDQDVSVQEAFQASVILAAITANNLHMSEEDFLRSCSTIYKSDNEVKRMEMQ
jgi:hypothetical protein